MIGTWCNNFINIPFKDCGRTRDGADCWGLARIIYKEKLGIELPELLGYADTNERKTIAGLYEIEHQDWQEIPLGEEKEFDIIIFRTMGLPTHVGVAIGDGFMIHSERSIGTCISNYRKELMWKKRIVGAYRYARNNSSKINSTL